MQHYDIRLAHSPIIATAIHDGHNIPNALSSFLLLNESERFREEDPYTREMAVLPVNSIPVNTSRFYADLNREETKALYLNPQDAWGLKVWNENLPESLKSEALAYYHQFYEDVGILIENIIENFGCFFILDIHSYNHKRDSPKMNASILEHPEINLGTFYNQDKWHPLLEKIKGYLSYSKISDGYPVDVRNNVIFKGGYFAQWVIKHYGEKGAVVSLEFKKTFMDEWTGRAFPEHINEINRALAGIIPLIESELLRGIKN